VPVDLSNGLSAKPTSLGASSFIMWPLVIPHSTGMVSIGQLGADSRKYLLFHLLGLGIVKNDIREDRVFLSHADPFFESMI